MYVELYFADDCLQYTSSTLIENIGITGFGRIDGNREAFPNKRNTLHPMLLRFLRCSNIYIKEIHLYNTAAWTTAFLDSKNIWIRSVGIWNEEQYNGDGLDFGRCSHVFVPDSKICGRMIICVCNLRQRNIQLRISMSKIVLYFYWRCRTEWLLRGVRHSKVIFMRINKILSFIDNFRENKEWNIHIVEYSL